MSTTRREVPTAPSAGSLVAVLAFLAIVAGGGWFVYDRFNQQTPPTEARSLAPVPPSPKWHTDDNGAQTGEFDTEAFSEFFVRCGLPPLENKVPLVERGQCESFYTDLKALGSTGGSDEYGAIGRYFHFWKLVDEARACYEVAKEKAPDDYKWHHYLAYIAFNQDRLEEAEQGFLKAISLLPPDAGYAGSHMQLARLYVMSGRPEDAKVMYRKAVDFEPKNPHPWAELGHLAMLAGDLDEAKRLELEAISRDENDRRAHAILGMIYGRQGNDERADFHEDRAGAGANFSDPVTDHRIMDLRRLTNALIFHQQIAELLFQAEKWGQLAAKQEEIVRRDPRIEEHTRLALAYSRAKLHDKAREAARAAIEKRRDRALTHYQLGTVEKRAGDFDAAIEKADDAIARDPQFIEAYRLKAECYGAQKKFAEGERVVDQGLAMLPTDFELLCLKGQFVFMQGYQLYERAAERERNQLQPTPLPSSTDEYQQALRIFYQARSYLEEARRLRASSDSVLGLQAELRRNVVEVETVLRSRGIEPPSQEQASSDE